MADNPYISLIRLYFPAGEVVNANCIANAECDPNAPGYPVGCVSQEGTINCGNGPKVSTALGVFKLLDSCWNPAMNPTSPFTADQWARVMDPNYNVWMASVIWSKYGWRAWTTCEVCNVCNAFGGPIPYPRGPVEHPGEVSPLGINLLALAIATAATGTWVYMGARNKDRAGLGR